MTHIEQRADFASQWTIRNPVMYIGEVGWELDTRRSKLGDGVTDWNSLPYTGLEGPRGPEGSVWFAITGTPNPLLGVDGDWALDTVSGQVWNKIAGVWEETADLTGPTGPPGPGGVPGGAAGGDLAGTYPNPTVKANVNLSGNPTATTPATADDDTSIATTAFVKAQAYAKLASPTFTGDPTAPTPATADDDTSVATTAFVKAQLYAKLANPTFTGSPSAPNPAVTSNGQQLATTFFVKSAMAPRVYSRISNTTTPLTSSGAAGIDFPSEVVTAGTTGVLFTYASGVYTTVAEGLYIASGSVTFANNTSGLRFIQIRVNGVVVRQNTVPGAGTMTPSVSEPIVLAVGDTVSLYVVQNSGATINVGGSSQSGLTLAKIGY